MPETIKITAETEMGGGKDLDHCMSRFVKVFVSLFLSVAYIAQDYTSTESHLLDWSQITRRKSYLWEADIRVTDNKSSII